MGLSSTWERRAGGRKEHSHLWGGPCFPFAVCLVRSSQSLCPPHHTDGETEARTGRILGPTGVGGCAGA